MHTVYRYVPLDNFHPLETILFVDADSQAQTPPAEPSSSLILLDASSCIKHSLSRRSGRLRRDLVALAQIETFAQ